MRLLPCLAVAAVLSAIQAVGQEPAVGTVIYETDFEGDQALAGWSGTPVLKPGRNGGQAVFFERPEAEGPGTVFSRRTIPLDGLGGCVLNLEGWIRMEAISKPPNSWNGVKYMAPCESPGGTSYSQAKVGQGSKDWHRVVYAVRIPTDATKWQLHLGLESVTGRVWFDDLRIVVRKLPVGEPKPVTDGPAYRGHHLPRLRGAMVSDRITPESLKTFGRDWNANLIRWQLTNWQPKGDTFDLDAYDRWLETKLALLDAALPYCKEYGMYVVVDLHSKPCGGPESGKSLFNSKECQERFVSNWRKIAKRYRDSEVVWGFDLANEPIEQAVDVELMDWHELAQAAAKAVREVDTKHAIIVECAAGGNPYGYPGFEPIDVPGVVYSVHMYLPHAFTHQGVKGEWSKQYTYPGEIGGTHWDKERLEQSLKPVIDFQKGYNVHIYLGEFSAIRWAPDNSAYRYLRDCIDIFEKHGWDWSYHAFREYTGWSVEHSNDREVKTATEQPNDRQKLLRSWLEKNEKPKF
jgi:aryl-phospho-beta-D-glucosidase BglC (GH1 family)